MRSSRRLQWIVLCGIVASSGLAGGCTNSDDLGSGVDRMAVDVELQNPATRFAVAGLSFTQLLARPADPTADQVLGTDPIGLIASVVAGIDVDFNGGATSFEIGSTLPAGTYRLDSLVLDEILFQQGTPSATPMNCVGQIATYTQQGPIQISDFGGEVFFTVTEGSSANRLRITIDGAALAQAFEMSWGCGCRLGPTCSGSITSCAASARCVTSFRQGDFANFAPTYLQVQANP